MQTTKLKRIEHSNLQLLLAHKSQELFPFFYARQGPIWEILQRGQKLEVILLLLGTKSSLYYSVNYLIMKVDGI